MSRPWVVATSAVSTPRSVLLSADCLLQRSAGVGAETFLARLGRAVQAATIKTRDESAHCISSCN